MALQKQTIPLMFGQGLDKKTDSKLVQTGFLELENVYQEKSGQLRKRNGYRQLSASITPSGTISSCRKLAVFKNELTLIGDTNLYSWSPGAEKWISKGEIVSVSVTSNRIISNSYEQTSADSATSTGVTLYAWEDTRGGVRAALLDATSKAVILADQELTSTGSRPKVLASGTFLFVFYYKSSGALVARRIDVTSPSAFSSEVTIGSNVNTTTPYFDVCNFGTRMLVAYRNTANEIAIAYYLQENIVGSTIYGVPNATTIVQNPDGAITLFPGVDTSTFWVIFHNTATGLTSVGMNSNFTAYKAAVVLDNYVATAVRNITGYALSGTLTVFYELAAASALNHSIRKQTLTISTNVAGTAATLVRSVGLASKVFTDSSAYYFMGAYKSDLQSTYFVLRSDGFIAGKALPNVSGGHTEKQSLLPTVTDSDDGAFSVPALIKTQLISENATLFTLRGVSEIGLEFSDSASSENAQLGENLHIVGSFLKAYDGLTTIEHGFHLYPEKPTSANSNSTGTIANGTYLYKVIWQWVDNQGQVHRSAPSDPLSVTVSGADDTVTLTIPTLRLTAKTSTFGRTEVMASVFRTTASGTVYYKVSSSTSPTYNSTTTDTISFIDTLPDASITSNEILYTVGGAVENIAAPSCTLVKNFKNRLIIAGLENGNQWWFSKEHMAGEGVQFSDVFVKSIDPTGGSITAIWDLDDKLVFFKESALFATFGDGPNDRGTDGDFEKPEMISGEVGCMTPSSIVRVKDGLMFQSNKGIYLLTRGLDVQYIGDKVEEYNTLTITGATSIDDLNQVRFTTEEGRTLVYDSYFQQWSTFTNQVSVSSLTWNNQFMLAKSDGTVLYEVADFFSDVNVPIPAKIVTGNLSFAGIQGFQRIYSGMILGEYEGEHTLKVSIANDFQEFYNEEFTTVPNETVNGTSYGGASPYGTGVYGDSEDGVYQFKFQPKNQKCQSMRIKIEDLFPTGTGTASFNISAITFEVGVLPGSVRLGQSKVMAST